MGGGKCSYILTLTFAAVCVVQLTGKEAIATDDNVDLIRSTLAEVLPVTYGAINPVAVKNVTSCPELPEAGSPAAAPAPPAQRGSGRRLLLDSFQVSGFGCFAVL